MFSDRKNKYVLILLILSAIVFIVYQSSTSSSSTGYILKTWTENLIQNTWNNSVLLNLKEFQYLINNEICDKENGTIIQIVTSYAGNVEARSAFRLAYPKTELEKLGIIRVFLLAKLKSYQNEISQNALLDENRRYNDLIQGNFYESYRNLTYKHVMGLKWVVTYCSNMKYIIKVDDDIVTNLYELRKLIDTKFKNSTDLMGYLFKEMLPIRMKANKWYVTREEYSGTSYPQFLSGWMYITTPAVAARLVDIAHHLPYFWIDDLFITGIVANELNSSFQDIGYYFTTHPELLECCIMQNVACRYLVAPSGGDYKLQIRFQNHSKKCLTGNICKVLSGNKTIEQTCVAKRKLPTLKKGISSYKIIKL